MSSQHITITGASICLRDRMIRGQNVIIKNGFIAAISNHVEGEVVTFSDTDTIIPGMIDCHIHGANGADVMDSTQAALRTISSALYQEGVTGYLATTMTDSPEKMMKALSAVNQFMEQDANCHIVGIHLEGPFLSSEFMGAQRGELILDPSIEMFEQFQTHAGGRIKLVTLAPEKPGAVKLIKHLVESRVIPSIGHTAATCCEARAGIDAGITHATHLFNAMRGFHHREPGAVGAILMSDTVTAELIADGVHLDSDTLKLALHAKGVGRLILVTDAMRAKCLGEGKFDLGGQEVTVSGHEARLDNGVLAGSVLTMNQALKNLVQYTGLSLSDAIQLTSINPARILGMLDRGEIAVGKRADLVVLDQDFGVKQTFVLGCGQIKH